MWRPEAKFECFPEPLSNLWSEAGSLLIEPRAHQSYELADQQALQSSPAPQH